MKIVIDIREDLYEGIERRDGALETEYVCDELMKAVDNGTPLPKGHGRLIDADALEEDYDWCEYKGGSIVIGYQAYSAEQIENAPTIIEADTESEDKKKLSWLGKRCEDCGNKKCKELGELPKGYDCALWQAESEVEE